MTAALLDRTVARTLGRNGIATASLQQRQDLAAVIHLCGSGAGNAYARRGFRLRRGQRCGDHDARRYLAEVNALKRQFTRFGLEGDQRGRVLGVASAPGGSLKGSTRMRS